MKGKTLGLVGVGFVIAIGASSCSPKITRSEKNAAAIAAFFNNEERRFQRFSQEWDSLSPGLVVFEVDEAAKRELFRLAEEYGLKVRDLIHIEAVRSSILANPDARGLSWPLVPERRVLETLADSTKSIDVDCPPWKCPLDRLPGDTTKYRLPKHYREWKQEDFEGKTKEEARKIVQNNFLIREIEGVTISGGAFTDGYKKELVRSVGKRTEGYKEFAAQMEKHASEYSVFFGFEDRRGLFALAQQYGLGPEEMLSVVLIRNILIYGMAQAQELSEWPPSHRFILEILAKNYFALGSRKGLQSWLGNASLEDDEKAVLGVCLEIAPTQRERLEQALEKRIEQSAEEEKK